MKYRLHYSAFEYGIKLLRQEKGGNKYAILSPRVIRVLEGAQPRSQGGPVEGSPAHAAYLFSQGFGTLLGNAGIVDFAAGAGDAAQNGEAMPDDGHGGDFADHGADGP
jgi:hypothetical protein